MAPDPARDSTLGSMAPFSSPVAAGGEGEAPGGGDNCLVETVMVVSFEDGMSEAEISGGGLTDTGVKKGAGLDGTLDTGEGEEGDELDSTDPDVLG